MRGREENRNERGEWREAENLIPDQSSTTSAEQGELEAEQGLSEENQIRSLIRGKPINLTKINQYNIHSYQELKTDVLPKRQEINNLDSDDYFPSVSLIYDEKGYKKEGVFGLEPQTIRRQGFLHAAFINKKLLRWLMCTESLAVSIILYFYIFAFWIHIYIRLHIRSINSHSKTIYWFTLFSSLLNYIIIQIYLVCPIKFKWYWY